jgi:hypothetical protein
MRVHNKHIHPSLLPRSDGAAIDAQPCVGLYTRIWVKLSGFFGVLIATRVVCCNVSSVTLAAGHRAGATIYSRYGPWLRTLG